MYISIIPFNEDLKFTNVELLKGTSHLLIKKINLKYKMQGTLLFDHVFIIHCVPDSLFFFFRWLFQPIQGPGLLFSSIIIFSQTVGLHGRVISLLQGHYLNTGQHKHRINAYTHQTFIPWVGFEPTIPAFKRAKTVHALDCAATVTSWLSLYCWYW
jgi:hypothetical protein